ncbi:hypothetical protein [Apilactobacillus xinyiensis]|uniref:hypothetical protein n=1 Tax=Apilactobacillus xinyiensis TaxID=2841032 RepID=UPI00200FD7C5|nr:hypothetical protein [Apilactobacillus xinyiensis]MCL0330689.1 hypothetical protein [Apilactobacillus xinyiensis]
MNNMYNLDTILNLLSTAMKVQSKDDNWSKFFDIDGQELENIQNLLQQIQSWRSIQNAKGLTLDYQGNDFGVARNGADDDFYRFKIMSKRWQRVSDGTCNALYRLVANTLSVKPSEFFIHTNDLPNQIVVDDIPADKVETTEKTSWLLKQLENAVVYGIKIANVIFTTNNFNNLYVANSFQEETELTNVMQIDNTGLSQNEIYQGNNYTSQTEVVVSQITSKGAY